jgi:hypothetical protein
MLSVIKTMEGHSSRNWNTEHLQDMPGKFLNEWNCTQEGDFSLADELTGRQRRESLQNQIRERKSRRLMK